MARYKKTGFMDDDAGSVSSIQLNEGVRSGGTHIRYHMESCLSPCLFVRNAIAEKRLFMESPMEASYLMENKGEVLSKA
ncbi:hypothetical protein B5X24_HaOG212331 [Helicoverpa armigera]|nr:hypothetical protein B5X24_HaOG212331 [Helicoverpa armigera]